MSEYRFVKKKISELFNSYINGCNFKSEDFSIHKKDDMLPVLKIANVSNSGMTDFTNCYYHTRIGYEKFVAHKGDLAFSLTGSLGYVSVVSEDCLVNQRVFVIRKQSEYEELLQIIQPLIKSSAFTDYCFSNATSESNKNISYQVICGYKIPICVDENGLCQLDIQKELSDKYLQVEEQKKLLLEKIEVLNKTKIIFEEDASVKFKNVPLTNLFTPKGGNMNLSKEWCKKNIGEYPVYSGSTTSEVFEYINDYEYDGTYLTWVIDGLAGYVMILDGNFSITSHRGILLPTSECKGIDLQYIKYNLEPIFRERARGRVGINGKNEYTALKPIHIKKYNDTIPIPIKDNGEYDLEKQQELAQKIAYIESIKEDICNKVKELIDVVVV